MAIGAVDDGFDGADSANKVVVANDAEAYKADEAEAADGNESSQSCVMTSMCRDANSE